MQNHERQSHAGSPPPDRPDVPRPAAPVRIILPSPDATVLDLDLPEPMTDLDHLAMLPQAARVDIATGAL